MESIGNLSGQSVGGYDIQELLGEGGSSAVYRATDRELKRDVAVKIITSPVDISREKFIERFNRQVLIEASLEHEAIVPIYNYGVQDDLFYIVFRLLTSCELTDIVGLPLEQRLSILSRLADALDYAHGKGVVHGDVKRANILLDERTKPYLVDFGHLLIYIVDMYDGMAVGTPSYMAPEQWRGDKPNIVTDQYNFGVTAFELITARLPFEAETPYALMMKHLNDSLPPVIDGQQSSLDAPFTRALAKHPDDRYPTVTDFVDALRSGYSQLSDDERQSLEFDALSPVQQKQTPLLPKAAGSSSSAGGLGGRLRNFFGNITGNQDEPEPPGLVEVVNDKSRTTLPLPDYLRTQLTVVEVAGKPVNREVKFNDHRIVFGRSREAADVVLQSDQLSRAHASIVWESSGFYVVDHGSKAGTFVNDARISTGGRYRLDHDRFDNGTEYNIRLGTDNLLSFRGSYGETVATALTDNPFITVVEGETSLTHHKLGDAAAIQFGPSSITALNVVHFDAPVFMELTRQPNGRYAISDNVSVFDRVGDSLIELDNERILPLDKVCILTVRENNHLLKVEFFQGAGSLNADTQTETIIYEPFQSGDRIGRYQVESVLANNTMNDLLLVADANKIYVLKILSGAMMGDERIRTHFEQEIQWLSELDHPHIIPLLDQGQHDDGRPFYTMPYLPGGTLVKQTSSLPIQERVNILVKIADALAYIHDQGIIHADVKPDNILLDGEGDPYLADFGIARSITNQTVDGQFSGTAAYAPPEQREGESLTPAADVYALARTAYRVLTLKESENFPAIGTIVLVGGSSLLPGDRLQGGIEVDPSLPDDFWRLLEFALQGDEPDRPSMAHFRERLQAAFDDAASTRIDHKPVTPDPTPEIEYRMLYMALRVADDINWGLGRTERVILITDTDPFPRSRPVAIPADTPDYTVTLRGDGVTVADNAAFTFIGEGRYQRDIEVYPSRVGSASLWAEVVAAETICTTLDQVTLDVRVHENLTETPPPDQLPAPPTVEGLPAFSPDVVIQLHRFDLGSVIRLYGVAHLPVLGERNAREFLGYRDLSPALIDGARMLLRRAVRSNPGEGAAKQLLLEFGRYLWDVILPPKLSRFYKRTLREIGMETELSIETILLVVDERDDLPYELAVPSPADSDDMADTFLCEEFDVTRWVAGLGRARQTAFPVSGEVFAVRQNASNDVATDPFVLDWSTGRTSAPFPSLAAGLTDPVTFGFHITDTVDRFRSLIAVDGDQDNIEHWQTYASRQQQALTAKAPLVSMSARRGRYKNDLTTSGGPLQLLRSGASAIVGTRWGVSARTDRLFWSAFYGVIYDDVYGKPDPSRRPVTLARALRAGREAVRQVDPNPLAWAAYYALGEPEMRPYRVKKARGYLTMEIAHAETSQKPLRAGEAIPLTFRFSTRPPDGFYQKRRQVPPVGELPARLRIEIPNTKEPEIWLNDGEIRADGEYQVVEWETGYTFPETNIWTLKTSMFDKEGQRFDLLGGQGETTRPSAEFKLSVTEAPVPTTQTTSVGSEEQAEKRLRRHVLVNFVEMEKKRRYLVNDDLYDVGHHDDIELDAIGRSISRRLGKLMHNLELAADGVTVSDDMAQVQALTDKITGQLDTLLADDWWRAYDVGHHVTVIERPYQVPWEIKGVVADKPTYWGLRYPTGYMSADFGDASQKPANEGLRLVMLADTTCQQQRTRLAQITSIDGAGQLPRRENRLNALGRLQRCVHLTASNFLHLAVVGQNGISGSERLILELPDKMPVELDHSQDITSVNKFSKGPIIFLSATTGSRNTVVDVLPYIEMFLSVGARAVIAPLCTLPDAFNSAFSATFYDALYRDGATLGGALVAARQHMYQQHHNPMGLAYVLFGDPQIQVEV